MDQARATPCPCRSVPAPVGGSWLVGPGAPHFTCLLAPPASQQPHSAATCRTYGTALLLALRRSCATSVGNHKASSKRRAL